MKMKFTKEHQDSIKEVFGANYLLELHKKLIKLNIVNKNGNPYSTSHIRQFIYNQKENERVKMEIAKLLKKEVNRLEKQRVKMEQCFNK